MSRFSFFCIGINDRASSIIKVDRVSFPAEITREADRKKSNKGKIIKMY
ncbi:MAG: hypothetical protein ACRCT1_19205 [Microcoleaceae cyanobacterium]